MLRRWLCWISPQIGGRCLYLESSSGSLAKLAADRRPPSFSHLGLVLKSGLDRPERSSAVQRAFATLEPFRQKRPVGGIGGRACRFKALHRISLVML